MEFEPRPRRSVSSRGDRPRPAASYMRLTHSAGLDGASRATASTLVAELAPDGLPRRTARLAVVRRLQLNDRVRVIAGVRPSRR